jgi:hypothetical protein
MTLEAKKPRNLVTGMHKYLMSGPCQTTGTYALR